MSWTAPFEEFRGKVVLVTGASSGIGAAVATAFGACGARVVVHAHANVAGGEAVVAAIAGAGGRARLERADLSKPTEARPLIERVAAAEGGIDVLINNAGHVVRRVPTVEIDDEFARHVVDLNFTSLFDCCRAVIPVMRRAGGGAIVNTTSIAARMGGMPGSLSYAGAKGAVSSITKGLGRELAPDRIRVNAVAPGIIRTPLHDKLTTPAMMAKAVEGIPMRREGGADECVGAFLFLASERLASYITGQIVEVSGGMV
jgi:3-oxoacyl-[acyl-carrier protein] reductase